MTGSSVSGPPRVLVAVAGVVLAVTTVLAVLGAVRTGVTTDEPIHVMRLRNFFDTGWYALDWDYTGAGPGGDGTNTYVYAPVDDAAAARAGRCSGVWRGGTTSPRRPTRTTCATSGSS